ncbi:response regulator [Tepidibacillus sp. HK-1]|uniref:response regulator n=1 Tax=Tepidibacillus sp. HK-1 TaxID=1883407 RepID=UPI0008532615|nr:response regulator [Tepidibacillus sp. HK-1]GBF11144.1 nitrogen regulation protein NR(I) [Tepidibacillus sp. HK-1]
MKNILFVDDEKSILNSLRRLFIHEEYGVFLAENGNEALSILASENIDLLITDMKMPVMNGYELLKEVYKKYPKLIRIILSGFAEKEIIMKSIRENLAFFYLLKPWDNDHMINLINRLFYLKDILEQKNLLRFVEIYGDAFPSLYSNEKELRLKLVEKAEIEEIIKIIERDPSTTLRVLYFVNSAYGIKTGSVKKALNYLNLNDLENILFRDWYDSLDDAITQKNIGLIVNHSILTNKIVHYIYQELLCKNIDLQYDSVGLLCNIGGLILQSAFTNEYTDLITDAKEKKETIEKLEEKTFKMTSQEVGGYLLSWWGLPDPLIESASYLHKPLCDNIRNKELVYILHLANYYSWKFFGLIPYELNRKVFDLLGLKERNLEQMVHKIAITFIEEKQKRDL